MNKSKVIRWSGIAVILAGISTLAAAVIEDTPLIIYGFKLLGTLIGFVGIYQYQKDSAGILSLLSVVILLVTFVFYGSGSDNLGDIAFPIAVLVMGVASFQAGKFSRWASGALILGVIVDLIESFLPSLPSATGMIASLILAVGFVAIGYSLWTDATKPQASA